MALTLSALAPAKVNLCLYVGPTRPDGLHEICSLFQSITLADEIRMEPAGGATDEVICPGVEGPNLAATALERFRKRFGWEGPPLRITISKRIPVASGLSGGSADAAAVLRAAVAESGLQPDRGELTSLAMSLGADVPAQLEPGLRLVTGAGEQVERLEGLTELAAVLLTSEGGLSTGAVYAHADSLGLPREDLDLPATRLRKELRQAGGSPLALADLLHNDLQAAAIDLSPSAAQALELLRESGAEVALLSGSGPTAFGLYRGGGEAERARATLEGEWRGAAIAVSAAGADYAQPRPAAPAT